MCVSQADIKLGQLSWEGGREREGRKGGERERGDTPAQKRHSDVTHSSYCVDCSYDPRFCLIIQCYPKRLLLSFPPFPVRRVGEVTIEKELSSSSSHFEMRNLGALVTSVTITTIKMWLKK